MMMKANASGTPAKLLVMLVKLTIHSRMRPGTFCRLAAAKALITSPMKADQNDRLSELLKDCRKNSSPRISAKFPSPQTCSSST